MLFEHLKDLHTFVRESEIGGLDILRIICKSASFSMNVLKFQTEYWQPVELKESQEKRKGLGS